MKSHLAVSWVLVPVLTTEHCRQGWRCAHFPVRWFTSRARRAAVGSWAPWPDPTAETPPSGMAGLLGELGERLNILHVMLDEAIEASSARRPNG